MILVDLVLLIILVILVTVRMHVLGFWGLVGALAAGVLLIGVNHWLLARFFRLIAPWLESEPNLRSSRRRGVRHDGYRTRREARLDATDDDALRARIEKRPDDALALEILCERLLKAGRKADYAREMTYLLTLDNDMTIDEKCSRYHHLAEIYFQELKRPERALEMLRAIIENFPKTYQASIARQRMRMMTSQNKPID